MFPSIDVMYICLCVFVYVRVDECKYVCMYVYAKDWRGKPFAADLVHFSWLVE